jgi:hypothetical protein
MGRNLHANRTENRCNLYAFAWIVLLAATGGTSPVVAQTYISAEAIPSPDIVGQANLASIESIGYPNLELWSRRLLYDCRIVQNVIDVLSDHRAISTVIPGNTSYLVAAGGFQGVTDPSYVFTMLDSGPVAVNQSDVWVLDNVLGYVLNQGGTAQFGLRYNPDNPNEFANAYAVVTFKGSLTGEHAEAFFNYLGTIDPALWTGTNAGFTQINLHPFEPNDSMLFLIGDVALSEFITGLFEAASTTPDATYSPLNKSGKPTVAIAGAAFPGNDWVTFPNGDQYLANLVNPSPQLLSELAALRQRHLHAVANLLRAINNGNVSRYLNYQFTCPAR